MSAFRRNEKGLVRLAKHYIDNDFTDIPDDEYRILVLSGVPVNRLSNIMKRLLELNKDVERVGWLSKGDSVLRDTLGTNLYNLSPEQLEFQPGGSEYQKALTVFQGMPFAERASAPDALPGDWQSRLRSRKQSDGAGPSSFGARGPWGRRLGRLYRRPDPQPPPPPLAPGTLRRDNKKLKEAEARLDAGRGLIDVEQRLVSIGAVPPYVSNETIEHLRKYFQGINILMEEISEQREARESLKWEPVKNSRDPISAVRGSEYRKLLKGIEGMPFVEKSSFGVYGYKNVNGRKRILYKGLYGGVYYKNTSGKKIYLKDNSKSKSKSKGLSGVGWENLVFWYRNFMHQVSWVHPETIINNVVKKRNTIETTIWTSEPKEVRNNYLDMIVSPDDDGNYAVVLDGKKYLVSGNLQDARKTFRKISKGNSKYMYKFNFRVNLTEVTM